MTDERINEEEVLAAIRADERYTVWSPCTTLERMGIERYPHRPNDNRLAMGRVLEALCAEGHLRRRERLHTHYTFREVSYERLEEGVSRPV